MNKFHTLIITLFIVAGLTSCKNDAQKPSKTIVNNNSALILGNWARSKTIDTVNTEGTVHIDSANVNDDYGYPGIQPGWHAISCSYYPLLR
jgi:uncharacterized protein YcfL